jgi:hypothetical protein
MAVGPFLFLKEQIKDIIIIVDLSLSELRHNASGGPITSNCSLFHSKSLNCNLWYLIDLLSIKNFDIAPFPLS